VGQFAVNISKWVEKTKDKADEVCRAVALELSTRIIMKSPVGNPELWAANAEAALSREQHNQVVDQLLGYLKSNPANLTANGNLKRGVRSSQTRRANKAQLAKLYPLKQGKGYVGGRFRGNWQVSIAAPAAGTLDRIDPGGGEAIAAASSALAGFTAGPTIYIMNNLPYAVRLEEGWSRHQAPNGMVQITIAEFPSIVRNAANAVASQ
jgi:hypothetical protein